jgi:hypothetical protein
VVREWMESARRRVSREREPRSSRGAGDATERAQKSHAGGDCGRPHVRIVGSRLVWQQWTRKPWAAGRWAAGDRRDRVTRDRTASYGGMHAACDMRPASRVAVRVRVLRSRGRASASAFLTRMQGQRSEAAKPLQCSA